VLAAVFKHKAGPGHKILHRVGDEHFAGASRRHHSRRHMDRDSADIAPGKLNLTGVYAGADFQAKVADRLANCQRAADGSRWSVKRS
jgi:hypothetical protein